MQKRISTIFLMVAIVSVMTMGVGIDSVDAKKSSGTYNQKYGSATKAIVCGDRLCSEISTEEEEKKPQKGTQTKSKTTSSGCGSNSIQTGAGCTAVEISGATIQNSKYVKDSGKIVIYLQAENDGKIKIMNSNLTEESIGLVLVDGEEWDDVIVSGSNVTIEFFAGTEKIKIYGN